MLKITLPLKLLPRPVPISILHYKHCHNPITGHGGLREQMRIKPYANNYLLIVQWSDRCRRVVRHSGCDRIRLLCIRSSSYELLNHDQSTASAD